MNKAINQKKNSFWKSIPVWGWFIGLMFLIVDITIYYGTALIVTKCYPDFIFKPKIDVIDSAIPLFPYFFVQIYFMAYAFWVLIPIGIMFTKKGNYWNFILAMSTAFIIIFILFLAYPTYIDRRGDGLYNMLEGKEGWSYDMIRFLYKHDGGDKPIGCLPSIHVTMSILPWMFIVGRKELPYSFKIPSAICMWLVVPSTLLTKQHYIMDVIAALILCMIVFSIYNFPNIGLKIENYITNKKKKRV